MKISTIRRLFLALLLASVALLGLATPAFAASCSGSSCVGKDPSATGCATGATSVASVRPAGGGPAVSLRWSSACRSNWARLEDGSVPGYWDYWVQTSDGHTESKEWSGAFWSWMVNGNLSARACIKNGVGQVSCTNWY